jgi:hypothetical protein
VPKGLIVLLNLSGILSKLVDVVGHGVDLSKFLNLSFCDNGFFVDAVDLAKLSFKLVLVLKHQSDAGVHIGVVYVAL